MKHSLEYLGLEGGGKRSAFYMECSKMRSQHLSSNSNIGSKPCGSLGEESCK